MDKAVTRLMITDSKENGTIYDIQNLAKSHYSDMLLIKEWNVYEKGHITSLIVIDEMKVTVLVGGWWLVVLRGLN